MPSTPGALRQSQSILGAVTPHQHGRTPPWSCGSVSSLYCAGRRHCTEFVSISWRNPFLGSLLPSSAAGERGKVRLRSISALGTTTTHSRRRRASAAVLHSRNRSSAGASQILEFVASTVRAHSLRKDILKQLKSSHPGKQREQAFQALQADCEYSLVRRKPCELSCLEVIFYSGCPCLCSARACSGVFARCVHGHVPAAIA